MRRVRVERVYYENGVKVTRYAPAEAKGARDLRVWGFRRHDGNHSGGEIGGSGKYMGGYIEAEPQHCEGFVKPA